MLKTIVELYDKEPVENVLSACIFAPQLVVYLCDVKDNTLRKEQAVYRLLKSRGLDTKVRFYYLDTGSVAEIRRTVEAVAHDYPGSIFDFSGGKDLVLLMAAVVCQEKMLPAFYIDIERNRFINLRGCEQMVLHFHMPTFSVEDIFSIAGARVVGNGHFPLSQMNAEFSADARQIWTEVLKDPEQWNAAAGFFQFVSAHTQGRTLAVETSRTLPGSHALLSVPEKPLQFLIQHGILCNVEINDRKVRFVYKNALMQKCLQNHGIWLELHGYLTARDSGLFDDVRTSVVVEWDGSTQKRENTRNEIDVLLVQGITPVFISCKMGMPTPLALSEIKILSEQFGGAHTKTVLLTATSVRTQSPSLAQRAKDLGIFLMDRKDLQQGNLAQRLAKIARE